MHCVKTVPASTNCRKQSQSARISATSGLITFPFPDASYLPFQSGALSMASAFSAYRWPDMIFLGRRMVCNLLLLEIPRMLLQSTSRELCFMRATHTSAKVQPPIAGLLMHTPPSGFKRNGLLANTGLIIKISIFHRYESKAQVTSIRFCKRMIFITLGSWNRKITHRDWPFHWKRWKQRVH